MKRNRNSPTNAVFKPGNMKIAKIYGIVININGNKETESIYSYDIASIAHRGAGQQAISFLF
jgi:hypothetical protein